jgi:hypothetical protein
MLKATITQETPPTAAETLAAKIARIEWLRSDNEADWFPSFQARLVDGERSVGA